MHVNSSNETRPVHISVNAHNVGCLYESKYLYLKQLIDVIDRSQKKPYNISNNRKAHNFVKCVINVRGF